MELFLIYLWLKLDGLVISLAIMAFVLGLMVFIMLFPRLVDEWDVNPTDGEKVAIKWHKRSITLFVIMLCASVILPSSKDMAILVGSSIAIDAIKSPEGQKISVLLRGKANELLDAEIEKLKKGK